MARSELLELLALVIALLPVVSVAAWRCGQTLGYRRALEDARRIYEPFSRGPDAARVS